MKTMTLFTIFIFTCTFSSAQDNILVPKPTQEQKQEILYTHVIAYAAAGISFAKTKGSSPEEYGRSVGKLFTPFWDPAGGYGLFANQIMFILAGMHPDNEMQIIEQQSDMIRFRMKNVDSAFQNGNMIGVTFEEFLLFSSGILSELADFMNVKFSYDFIDNTWYEVSLKAK